MYYSQIIKELESKSEMIYNIIWCYSWRCEIKYDIKILI